MYLLPRLLCCPSSSGQRLDKVADIQTDEHTWLALKRRWEIKIRPKSPVDVTIVIPTFARPAGLRACLDGIAGMDCDLERVEVIVVDDGGPSGTGDIVASFENRLRIRIVRQSRGGPARARNKGADLAAAGIIAFIDDDCIPHRHWLAAILHALSAHPGALVGGPVLNGLPDNPYAAASQTIATFVAAHYASGFGAEKFFTTNNLAVSAARLRALGGFDSTIPSWTAEDKEFCDRWRRSGFEMIWVEDAVVDHFHDLTFRKFVRQHFDYGRGILTFRMRRNARSRKSGRLVPESVSFYRQLVTHPLTERRDPRAMLLVALSQIATLAGALSSAVPKGRWSASRTPESRLVTDLGET